MEVANHRYIFYNIIAYLHIVESAPIGVISGRNVFKNLFFHLQSFHVWSSMLLFPMLLSDQSYQMFSKAKFIIRIKK